MAAAVRKPERSEEAVQPDAEQAGEEGVSFSH
jgi:hypothetical protein